MSYAEYLAAEAVADVRHEYLAGDVWAMAGGTIEHGGLAVAGGEGDRPGAPLASLAGRSLPTFG
jgi:hypothetical protein